ncbi:MAG: hypothetical protein ABI880_10755 [Acidobacteriota bacterium]
MPYVFSQFRGPNPSPANLPVDGCRCWHSALQDFGGTVRFALLSGRVGLTPSVSIGVPSHAYQFEGEAVAGYGLREVRVAVDGGLRLDAISTRLALQSRYQYAMVENVLDVPNNRSNSSATASYLVTSRLSLRGGAAWQRTHGGLRLGSLTGVPFSPPGEFATPELFRQHDRLLRNNYWHVGGGATYSLNRLDLFVSYLQFISGTDTHAGKALTVGASWPFQRTP